MKKKYSIYGAVAISHSHPINTLYQPDKRSGGIDYNRRITRDDPEDARICLTCTKKKCTGGRDCFESRKRKLMKEGLL